MMTDKGPSMAGIVKVRPGGGVSVRTGSSEYARTNDNAAPRSSGGMTQYFLLILAGFGVLQFALNLSQHPYLGHQNDHISDFQRKHFHMSHSQSRKSYNDLVGRRRDQQQDDEDDDDDDDDDEKQSKLAGLNCEAFGGPSNQFAQEMVYWEDIPSDNAAVSPFKPDDDSQVQYMTFESDHGGWNNIRMAMETVLTMALAMGRTLVLPPEQRMYLLTKDKGHTGTEQRDDFSYNHFFHTEHISEEHVGLNIITMSEFLEREGLAGNLKDVQTGEVLFPPENRTVFDGHLERERRLLQRYLRRVGLIPDWNPEKCLAVFPSGRDPELVPELQKIRLEIELKPGGFGDYNQFIGKPTPVDAPPGQRMKENWASREDICIYDEPLQKAPVLHFAHGMDGTGARLLVHFYAFLFFQDWRQDLWMKRFVRDHVRYIDEIQCAAARVVHAIRERSLSRSAEAMGAFDTLHVRRGDFQYKPTRFEADRILKNIQPELVPGGILYIATDEQNKNFFDPFRKKYDVLFLDDFKEELQGVNTNYYGMIDQLIASRGRIFFGCWFSTFTGYINRLRGYHANKAKGQGYELGVHRSYYYALEDRKFHLQEFWPVKKQFYAREFPTSWRLIDKGIGELKHLYRKNEEEDDEDEDGDDEDEDDGDGTNADEDEDEDDGDGDDADDGDEADGDADETDGDDKDDGEDEDDADEADEK